MRGGSSSTFSAGRRRPTRRSHSWPSSIAQLVIVGVARRIGPGFRYEIRCEDVIDAADASGTADDVRSAHAALHLGARAADPPGPDAVSLAASALEASAQGGEGRGGLRADVAGTLASAQLRAGRVPSSFPVTARGACLLRSANNRRVVGRPVRQSACGVCQEARRPSRVSRRRAELSNRSMRVKRPGLALGARSGR